jgi:large subunit ribosomal protein L18e
MAPRRTKLNPELLRLVVELRRAGKAHGAPIWTSVADRLERARHQVLPLNVGQLDRLTQPGDTVAVPGKLLAAGPLSKRLTVGAFAYSSEARAKVHAAGGTPLSLHELVKARPDGAGVRLLA